MKKKRLLIATLILVAIGLVMVYSSSHIWAEAKFNDSFYYIKRQALFAVVGLVGMFCTIHIDYHFYQKHALKILIVCFILLILVLIPGLGMVRGGSRSWFAIGSISLQPSELFKIGMIIFAAKYISIYYHYLKKARYALTLLVVAFLGFALIMLQPDFGTGVVMLASIVIMIIASPFKFIYFVWLGIGGVAGLVGLIASAPYRLARIVAYLDPFQDPLGSGFQMIQSLYAIGPGGLLGVGFDNSVQKHFYLPEPQTDFIFAIICEEFGLIGAGLVVCLYLYLIIRGVRIALDSKDLFGTFLALGITAMLGIQIMINLGVVVGLFPVTGVTLPFMSYGGTSLTIVMTCVGILINIEQFNG
ncbi:MAG: stage V sporulation protein E [Beduini sp.]|uniref:stage V sporulation protein E n=1 Tax=Beduini sp. TaxID=1922300 RepID=UPI00399EEA00